MAALGAAAGAFEGDMEREAAAARRAQLGLQAQRMNQDAQQFYEKTKLDRELMASEEAENAAKRQENADALALRQKNTDRQFALDEKKFQAGRENDAYLRGRDERKDAWSEALNTQELENRSLEARKLNAEYAEMQRLRKQGEEARANKTRLVESAAGLIIRSGIENGAASPEELAVFSKAIGKQTDMAYPAGDGSFVIRTVEGVDKQTGQPIFKERLLDPTVVAAVMEKFQDPMDPRKPNVPTTDAALFRQQSLEQRESMKYENEKNIASLRGQRAPRFDAQQLDAVKDDILDLESALNAKGLAPEKKAQLEAELKEAKAFKRSLIYGGAPSAQAAAAQSGNGASAQASVPPDVSAEQQKALKLAMQKPEKERRAYYDQHMKQFMSTRGNGGQAAQPEPTGQYETKLSPQEEIAFREWKAKYAPNDSGYDYDLRGAFKAGLTPGKNGHWSDRFKKPNHPTFSNESQYARDRPDLAGKWDGETYIPPTSSFGPDRGDQAYWRDMPTGAKRQDAQQAKPSAKEQRDAVNAQRKAILRRKEIAYRMEKGPEKTAAIAKIQAELDAFNEVNPL